MRTAYDPENEAMEGDDLDLLEDALAALTPTAKRILAGLGSGDTGLQSTLLDAMPTGTEALLRSLGALNDNRALTKFGDVLAEQVAFELGMAPDPSVRVSVARELAKRLSAGSAG